MEAHAAALAQQRVPTAAQEGATHLVGLGGAQIGSGRERPGIDHQRIDRALAQAAFEPLGAAARDLGPQLGVVRGHVHQQRRHAPTPEYSRRQAQ
jgi:hypothetical protein